MQKAALQDLTQIISKLSTRTSTSNGMTLSQLNLTLGNSNKTLYLTYSAVPEPSTYVMVSGLLVLPAINNLPTLEEEKAKATEEEEETQEKA